MQCISVSIIFSKTSVTRVIPSLTTQHFQFLVRHDFYSLIATMSQAFVKENDEEWLHDVQPTLNALIVYLTRQNSGIRGV
jgi:hypothetical protein